MNVAGIIDKSGASKVFRPFYSGFGHILMFHRIWNTQEYLINNSLQVSQEYLALLIQYFRDKGIDIVDLDEAHARIVNRKKNKRFVTFTFDDGYADNLTHALPVFEQYNVPFSVFLSTCYPDRSIVLWWYLLEDLLANNSRLEFSHQGREYAYDLQSSENVISAYWEIRKFIMESGSKNLMEKLKTVFGEEKDLFKLTEELALSWDQVNKLIESPLVTLGAHSKNHYALSQLSDEESFSEINDSIRIIKDRTGIKTKYFAYPFGTTFAVSDREFKLAADAGLTMALTTESNNVLNKYRNKPFSLPRIEVTESMNNSHFNLFINGMIPFYQRMNRFLKR